MLSFTKITLGLLVVFNSFFLLISVKDIFAYFKSDREGEAFAVGSSLRPSTTSGVASNDRTMASEDSLGLFDDIPNSLWLRMKKICLDRHDVNKRISYNPPAEGFTAQIFHTHFWDPDFSCPTEEKIGNIGDGHKWVCDPYRVETQSKARLQAGRKGCIIYSIGSSGDFAFEQDALRVMPSCEIHTFDYTDYTEKIPPGLNIHYHAWGIKSSSDVGETRPNFKTIPEIVRELGHEHQVIDLFKIDCEGCEMTSYKDWINNASIDIRQILVEVHFLPPNLNDFFLDIANANYVIFHKEANILDKGQCIEYAFLKMGNSFFRQGP